MTLTFLEAYALYGRDSAAIARACGMATEAEAYNRMAAQVEADRKAGIKRSWYAKNRQILYWLRQEARL